MTATAEPRSAVVELRADGEQAATADAIGRAALARDQLPAPEALEDAELAIVEPPALAIEAVDLDDLARLRIAPVDDTPTLRQRVQHTLFVFRDVHWNSPCLGAPHEVVLRGDPELDGVGKCGGLEWPPPHATRERNALTP